MHKLYREVPCRLCERPTTYTGTKLCNGCWELDSRIRRDPDIAERILHNIRQEVIDKAAERKLQGG